MDQVKKAYFGAAVPQEHAEFVLKFARSSHISNESIRFNGEGCRFGFIGVYVESDPNCMDEFSEKMQTIPACERWI